MHTYSFSKLSNHSPPISLLVTFAELSAYARAIRVVGGRFTGCFKYVNVGADEKLPIMTDIDYPD